MGKYSNKFLEKKRQNIGKFSNKIFEKNEKILGNLQINFLKKTKYIWISEPPGTRGEYFKGVEMFQGIRLMGIDIDFRV